MIAKLTAAALAGLIALSVPAVAQAQAVPPQPDAGTTRPFRLPQVETFRLANGMQVTLVPYGLAPKTLISLRIDAGNLNDGADTWLADLTGDMLREGAAGRSSAQIASAAASMGGQLGISVQQLQTIIGLSVLSEHADDAIRLVADVAMRPDFPADELDRVRQNLVRNVAVARSQAQPIADAVFARAYYGDHPYGRLLPTDAQLGGYTIDQVRRFHADNYGARRARLYIAGRFDAAEVRRAVERAFGSWRAGAERLRLPVTPRPGPQLLLVNRPGAPQSTIRIGFPAPVAGGEGDIPMRVMNALLGGSFTSRITQNIREDKGYTYGPGSSIQFHDREALWSFQADVTTAATGPALHEVFSEIRRLQTETPPVPEARGMGTWLAGSFILQNGSAAGLVNSLATRDIHGLPANWLETYVPSVLAVSPEQIRSGATQRLPLDKMTVVVVGDLATIRPQIEALPEFRGWDIRIADPL